MNNLITGLHHITAMTSDAQMNVDFYAGILGLRLVKKTINFDAPDIYHLYYGNETGDPGTILTFFPFKGMVRGRKGTGQVTVISFSVPHGALPYWIKRLERFDVLSKGPEERFGEQFLYFEDYDSLGIELIAADNDPRESFSYGHIPLEYSIKGFHSVTLKEENIQQTSWLLTNMMDHRLSVSDKNRYRYSTNSKPGGYVDLLESPDSKRGIGGFGTVHHVAFATPDDQLQLKFRERLLEKPVVNPTPVIDRQYFHSVYFREPGGVLFEAATCDIGFTFDEMPDHLGESLKLPPWEEINRKEIESLLDPINLNIEKFRDYAYIQGS